MRRASSFAGSLGAFALAGLLCPRVAAADPAASEWSDRLVLDTGRPEIRPGDAEHIRIHLHGEYQARTQLQRSFLLPATPSQVQGTPTLTERSLGQNVFANHWLRLTPRLSLGKIVDVVAQAEVVTGLVVGQTADQTSADRTPRDSYDGLSNLQLRWLYADVHLPFGLVRIGHQPNHWGMGILANDGDHPALFGDYRYGQIVERVLFATKPGGKDSDVVLALAGDLVFRDNFARFSDGDRAVQGVLAGYWEREGNKFGLYGVARHQSRDVDSPVAPSTTQVGLDAGIVDAHGRFVLPVPGSAGDFLFGEAEAALVFGSTNLVVTANEARDGTRERVRSYGGAATLGFVVSGTERSLGADKRFGRFVGQVEAGYASGDADSTDGTVRRFTFDPNHKVGLLLFDEVLRFQTARSATAARDPSLVTAGRPPPGTELYPSQGGVFGAQYINPTAVFRPQPWLDVKGGAVVATSTADVVDPYVTTVRGAAVNARGGSPKRRDLGLELDLGFEARARLDHGITLQLGAQGGILFPGGALADAAGSRLSTPWIAILRAGLLF